MIWIETGRIKYLPITQKFYFFLFSSLIYKCMTKSEKQKFIEKK